VSLPPGRGKYRTAAIGGALFLLLLAVYLYSMPRTVVLEDDGFFLQAIHFAVPAHPPGYPLYVLLAQLVEPWPLATLAVRVHAFSAVIGAAAALMLYVFALRLRLARASAALSALALGFSAAFWSQSIIAEVYALHVLLLLALLTQALGAADWRGTLPVLGFGAVLGLGLSNHWPLLLLAGPALAVLLLPHRTILLRRAPAVAGGLLLGLTPYLWLVVRTHAAPDFCFDGPIRGLAEFWYFVSRAGYAAVDHSAAAGWVDKTRFAWFSFAETARQFGPHGLPLMALGMLWQWRALSARVAGALTLLFLSSGIGLSLLLGFDYDLLHRNTFRAYLLPAHLVGALWLALGLDGLFRVLRIAAPRPAWHWALVLSLAAAAGLANNAAGFRAGDRWADRYARALLDTLPRDAVLYANADTANAPAGYLHHVEGLRPDLLLQSGSSFRDRDGLQRPYRLERSAARDLFDRYLHGESRAVFYTNDFPQSAGAEDRGLYFRALPAEPGVRRVAFTPRVRAFLESAAAGPEPRDPWSAMHYRLLREDHCRLVLSTLPTAGAGFRLPSACDHYLGLLRAAHYLLLTDQSPQAAQRLLESAATRRAEAISREDYAELELLRGDAAQRLGNDADARHAWLRAADDWPHPENPAWGRLRMRP
jgi:hypothetical protein